MIAYVILILLVILNVVLYNFNKNKKCGNCSECSRGDK